MDSACASGSSRTRNDDSHVHAMLDEADDENDANHKKMKEDSIEANQETTEEQDRSRQRHKLSLGWDVGDTVNDLQSVFTKARKYVVDFVVIPLVHSRQCRDSTVARDEWPLTRSDTLLSSHQWSTLIVGKTSPWITFPQSKLSSDKADGGSLSKDMYYSRTFAEHENAFREEMALASHLSLPAVMIPLPSEENCVTYAQIVNQLLLQSFKLHVWVECPISLSKSGRSLFCNRDSANNDDQEDSPWRIWNMFRTLCGHHPFLHVALRLNSDIPRPSIIQRWLGEPVRSCFIPCSIFKPNKQGFPALIPQHQSIFSQFICKGVQFVLSGSPTIGNDLGLYSSYLISLASRVPPMSEEEEFEAPYHDYLQSPLQPLMDNLESATYEVFEKDPVKYSQYEEAIFRALKDRNQESVIMVVGAGRGPLIRCALRAGDRANIKITVFGVEKNPSAVITLRNLKRSLHWDSVTIVHQDMRTWTAPMLADILVSELLGSFGDNELSPECLDGAQRFLKPDTGISIPCSYTSFVAPITSHKLWNLTRALDQGGGASNAGLGAGLASSDRVTKNFETPYVVKLHNFAHVAQPKDCFTFVHPNFSNNTNRRMKVLEFVAEDNAIIHGFAGYFDTVLYDCVRLSILPETYSVGMFSWFPIYFPVATPMQVRKGDRIEIGFWRQVSASKVWYEWCLLSPIPGPIHNPNGRSYVVQLL